MSTGQSLREQIAATLRRQIVSVTLRPGQRLVERDLAAELNVSRIPVREALRVLATEGLVVQVPGRGTLVAPFGPDDVRDLFDVLEVLESLAARLAARHATPTTVAPLAAAYQAVKAAATTSDIEHMTQTHTAFHAEITTMAENPLLTSIMRMLTPRMEWLFRLTDDHHLVQQCTAHDDLFDLIARGDADGAAAAAWDHVESCRARSVMMAQGWFTEIVHPSKVASTRKRRKSSSEDVKRDDGVRSFSWGR